MLENTDETMKFNTDHNMLENTDETMKLITDHSMLENTDETMKFITDYNMLENTDETMKFITDHTMLEDTDETMKFTLSLPSPLTRLGLGVHRLVRVKLARKARGAKNSNCPPPPLPTPHQKHV